VKFKRFIHIGIVLGGSLGGCYIAWQQHVQSFLETLHPPSVDQVKKWAGLPEGAHLTMYTNVPDDVRYNDGDFGKFKCFWAYEDRKGSNVDGFVIAVYEPGAFCPSKRALLINTSKEMYKRYSDRKNLDKENPAEDGQAIAREMSPIITPKGQKSYGFLLGLAPGRFALHPEFDIMASEYVKPVSYDERYQPTDLTAMPTNSLSEFFTNADAFIASQ